MCWLNDKPPPTSSVVVSPSAYQGAFTLVFLRVSATLRRSYIIKCSIETGPRPAPVTPPVLEEDSVQFNKLSYLGCTWVKAPRNEGEAQRAMATLRAESAIPIPITLHVPSGPDGSVRSGPHGIANKWEQIIVQPPSVMRVLKEKLLFFKFFFKPLCGYLLYNTCVHL